MKIGIFITLKTVMVVTMEQIYIQMHICIGISFLKSDENFSRSRLFLLK